MPEAYGLVSGALTVVSYIPYTKDIFAKKAKPETASWLIWSVTGGIAFFSQISKGATHSLWFPGLDCLGSLFIFILAIKYGFGGGRISKRDATAFKAAGFGLILWALSRNSIYALVVTMFIDGIGTLLTAWKTLDYPYTETYPMWILLWAASIVAMLAVGTFNIELLAYPFFICMTNLVVIGAIFIGRKWAKQPLAPTAAVPNAGHQRSDPSDGKNGR